MFFTVVLLIAAFSALIYGANYFVIGASSIAHRLGVSSFVIGLTVVSIGTSAPELFVNVVAAFQGNTAISVGNILGSNMAGILLGLGIAALFMPLSIKHSTVWKEIPFALMAAMLILAFGSDSYLDGVAGNAITRTDGIALLGFFVIFLVYTFGLRSTPKRQVEKQAEEEVEKVKEYSWPRSLLFTLGGLIALSAGGKVAVDSGVELASMFGVSENLIGLTVIAAGTSLPEIVTAAVAAYKKNVDLVVGGIVGTIIFNAFFALGVTSLVRPLPFGVDNVVDAFTLAIVTIVLFLVMFVGKKNTLTKYEGMAFVVFYIAYILFAIWRG